MDFQIQSRKAELRALCRQYGVGRLDLFGLAATEAFDAATSDLDFIVEFVDSKGYQVPIMCTPEELMEHDDAG